MSSLREKVAKAHFKRYYSPSSEHISEVISIVINEAVVVINNTDYVDVHDLIKAIEKLKE